MQVTLLDTARIDRDWEAMAVLLQPAVAVDPEYDLTGLYGRLLDGSALAFEVSDGAIGLWVVSLEDDNGLVAWTTAIAGKIDGGPKARVETIRAAVRALEDTLKLASVKAHRICGRDWSAILPDYTPFDGARNGLQKELA